MGWVACNQAAATAGVAPPLPSPPKTTTHEANVRFHSYSKSRPFDQTLRLFRRLPRRDTVTWNTLISASSRRGRFRTSLLLFLEMLLSAHSPPDALTFRLALAAAMAAGLLRLALQIHTRIIKLHGSCSPDLITCTRLIGLYCELGSTSGARQLFDRVPHRDVVACASMMAGYNEAGEFESSLRVFLDMVVFNCSVANEFVYSSALRACAGLESLSEAEQIHALVVKTSMQGDVFVGTGLVDVYAKCNCRNDAKQAFSEIPSHNVASWNALMSGISSSEEVMRLLLEMGSSGMVPDHLTLAIVLRACEGASLGEIQQIHGLGMKILAAEMDVYLGGALFEQYLDENDVHSAKEVFRSIDHKDSTSFNLAIKGYSSRDYPEEAVDLFHELVQMGKNPNEATFTSLMMVVKALKQGKQLHGLAIKFGFSGGEAIASSIIKMYSDFDCLEDGIRLFDRLISSDVVLWTSLISGLSRRGESERALKLYLQMVSHGTVGPPTNYTLSSLLQSCSNLIAVEEGRQIHGQIIKLNYDTELDLHLASGLLDMYAKCGYIDEAKFFFENMAHRDLTSWNSMILGFSHHGFAEAALATFHELLRQPNMKPSHITYVGVLSACSHGGLVREGYEYFHSIKEPTIDHYACLVNLVARAGLLEEARDLIKEMPFQPNELIWSSVLAASRIYGHFELAEYSARHLLELNPNDPGTYIALSNVYADVGRWKDFKKIKKLMKSKGIGMYISCSWLSVSGKNHVFHAGQVP